MYNKILIITFLIITLNIKLFSQSDSKTVVLSNLVGDYIDKNENIKYKVFPDIYNFKSVKILWDSINYYRLFVTFNDSLKVKSSRINVDQLTEYSERIEFCDAINDGVYEPGYSNITIDTLEDKLFVRLNNNSFEKFPFARKIKNTNNFRPLFGFGGSLKFTKIDLTEIKQMFDYLEETISNKGFSIYPNNLDNGTNKMISANLFIRIYEGFGLYMEAGKSLNSKWNIYATSGLLRYYIDFPKIEWMKLHLGIGYTKLGFETAQNYFTPISSGNYGSFERLDSVTFEGTSKGCNLNIGTDIGIFDYKRKIYVTFFLDFNFLLFNGKEYSLLYDNGEINLSKTGKTSFNKFIISTGINIYL